MSDANNRLNELLISQIEKFDGALDKAVDFAAEQAPDLIQQLLLWNMTLSLVYFVVSLLVFIVFGAMCRKFWIATGTWDSSYDRDACRTLMGIFGPIVGGVLGLIVINSLTWLKILIAPKLYLLEYAAELVR